jgi:hypothetical protein
MIGQTGSDDAGGTIILEDDPKPDPTIAFHALKPDDTFDVMHDLETYGDGPGCAILSIGAVGFHYPSGWIDPVGFHVIVDLASCYDAGLRSTADTRAWWDKQVEAARYTLLASRGGSGHPIGLALDRFAHYLAGFGGRSKVRVWGNGADFDNAIVTEALRVTGRPPAWDHWNSRCFRTLKNLRRDVEAPARIGVLHNALNDAQTQAAHAIKILQAQDVATALVKTLKPAEG